MAEAAADLGLRELQRQLLALIRAPHGVADGLLALGLDADQLEALVDGDRRLSATGRVGIYADMYFVRLLEALRAVFPRVAAVLGDDAFAALATDYLEAHPSRHPSLRQLGDRLPGFLRDPAASRPHGPDDLAPWLADLAALEWARHDVFDDADAPPLALAQLQALPPDRFVTLPVRLVPAHRVVTVGHPVEAVWRAFGAGGSRDLPAQPAAPGTLLVWRQGTMVYHRPADPIEAAALALAATGAPFAAMCEVVAGALGEGQDPAQATFRLLARWIDDELLVALAEHDAL
jgi:hypothetical protein